LRLKSVKSKKTKLN